MLQGREIGQCLTKRKVGIKALNVLPFFLRSVSMVLKLNMRFNNRNEGMLYRYVPRLRFVVLSSHIFEREWFGAQQEDIHSVKSRFRERV